jgi:hypothetical protein
VGEAPCQLLTGVRLKPCALSGCPARRPHVRARQATVGRATQEQFDRLLDAQQHTCGMCHEPFEEGQLIHVDHDHACCQGKNRSCGECIRGLLCHACNIGLGHIERRYAMARAYLDSPPVRLLDAA